MTRRPHLQVVVSDGKIREDTCYHRTRDLPRIEDLRLDGIEQLFLKLFRHLCASLASDTSHGWEAALAVVEQEIGGPDGSALVNDIVPLLHAIRAERCGSFSFMPADCPICSRHLSEEERMTLDLLRAARNGDEARLLAYADALAGGGVATDLALAARILGEHLDIYALFAELRLPLRAPG